MKYLSKFGFSVVCFLWQGWAFGQVQNAVLSRSFKNGVATERNDVGKASTQIQYFDGLGRPIQAVSVGQSPSGADIVQPVEYDAFGREVKKYLPYTNASGLGSFRNGAVGAQNSFYSGNVANLDASDLGRPFAQMAIEPSPLNRTTSSTAPGNKSAASNLSYGSNQTSPAELVVKRYDFTENANILLGTAQNGNYAAGTLTYTKSIDENGKIMLEFKDRDGRVVLKRATDGAVLFDTYYVYDDASQLRAVLQPQFQDVPLNSTNFDRFAFLYCYDNRGRLITKKVPGAAQG